MNSTNFQAMKIINQNMKHLDSEKFEKLSKLENYQILDTRNQSEFMKAHIPKSINICLNPKFKIITRLIMEKEKNTLIVCQQKEEREIISHLICEGFHKIVGFLENGFSNWNGKTDSVNSISWNTLEKKDSRIKNLDGIILDIRKSDEHVNGIIHNSKTFPFPTLKKNFKQLDKNQKYYMICRTGKSSMASYCFLKNNGYNVVNIDKGFTAKPEEFTLIKPELKLLLC